MVMDVRDACAINLKVEKLDGR
ncbi:uncharacterized protein G2W53_014145 [Senna tora]|uniref:Uncharacterized protein n=1 Tax=Senna tora TaxID=362788 RepID=A0A835C7G9_9FABA|nr:uncharacterized protein G2W53_014145 [Senna tora]